VKNPPDPMFSELLWENHVLLRQELNRIKRAIPIYSRKQGSPYFLITKDTRKTWLDRKPSAFLANR
jgi:hypothetical protein